MWNKLCLVQELVVFAIVWSIEFAWGFTNFTLKLRKECNKDLIERNNGISDLDSYFV